jgi:PAS domain S-box-containing protein
VEIAVSLSPVRDDAGRIVAAAKIARDLSERREAERRMRELEQQLHRFVESVTEYAIFRITPDGMIASWNPGARLIKGYEEHEVVGKSFAMLFTPEDQAAGLPAKELADAAAQGEYKAEGMRRMRKNGEVFDASIVLTAVRDAAGRLEGFMKVTRDVTDRKRHEEELHRAKGAAEQANRAKDHFLAVLSHELRTPLTPVLAAVEQMQASEGLTQDLRDDLAMIRRNVELEARIIDDLLHLTRISRGKVELHFEVTDAHAALRHCLEMFAGEVESKRVELSLNLRASCHHVWADPARLQQVFCNLASNAVKFTPRGGRVTLRTSNEGPEKPDRRGDGHRRRDRPGVLPRVFEAFEQGERTITRRFGGLGLGLAIAKAIVGLHGGTIEAHSDGTDRGARFVVRLRAVGVPAAPPANPAAAGLAGARRREAGGAGPGANVERRAGRRIVRQVARAARGRPPRHAPRHGPTAQELRLPGADRRNDERGGRPDRPGAVRPARLRHRPARRQRAGAHAAGESQAAAPRHRAERVRHGRRHPPQPRGRLRAPPHQAGELRAASGGHPPGRRGAGAVSPAPVRRLSSASTRRPSGGACDRGTGAPPPRTIGAEQTGHAPVPRRCRAGTWGLAPPKAQDVHAWQSRRSASMLSARFGAGGRGAGDGGRCSVAGPVTDAREKGRPAVWPPTRQPLPLPTPPPAPPPSRARPRRPGSGSTCPSPRTPSSAWSPS